MCYEYHKNEASAIRAFDPNEKIVLADRFIQPDQLLIYPIHYENIGNAEALDVFVRDLLDTSLDESTLELLAPDGSSFDPVTRTVKWDLLGRNLEPGETDHVLFSIRPKPGLPSGTKIRNTAEIQFEVFEIFETPEVVNIIDSTPPNCVMDPLPSQVSTDEFQISWIGTDDIGEIDTYSIFASVDGQDYAPVFAETSDKDSTFVGEIGHSYEFFCVAKDTAGNIENQALIAETFTEVISEPDSDGDGVPDTEDNCPNTPNSDQADIDGDGVGDVCDECPDEPAGDNPDPDRSGCPLAGGVDTTPPICEMVRVYDKPPVTLEVRTQDPESGLERIDVLMDNNANVIVPAFAVGTNAEVLVEAEKIDASQSSQVMLEVFDVAGNSTVCDPIIILTVREKGKPVTETVTGIPDGTEVTVTNGTPGLKNLDIVVNGTKFKVTGLGDGQTRVIDVSSALVEGENTFELTAKGKPNTEAIVIIPVE